MTRASQTISVILLASSIYLFLALPLPNDPHSLPSRFLESLSIPGVLALRSSKVPSILPLRIQNEIVPYLPFWALITLASYLLGRLGLGVMRFKDCESAYTELTAHIEKAKKDLDSKNVGWS